MNSEQASTDHDIPVIEHATQRGNNDDEVRMAALAGDATALDTAIIWTPRFIIMFSLTLALGLSVESLITQAWSIRWFTGTWVFLVQIALVSAGWIALLVVSRSRWIRLGAVFGLVCAVFMAINIIIQAILIQPSNYLQAHVDVATCLALLGCYICLSIDRLPAGRWDAWFLGLTPITGVVLVALLYFLRPGRVFSDLENSITIAALFLSVLVWWMRPLCWKHAPGLTLLFGVAPFFLLVIYLVYVVNNSFNLFPVHVTLNASASFFTRETVFYFSQVPLLCLLLGAMRLIKSERIAGPGRPY